MEETKDLRDSAGIRESIIDKVCELVSGDPDLAKGEKGGLKITEWPDYDVKIRDLDGDINDEPSEKFDDDGNPLVPNKSRALMEYGLEQSFSKNNEHLKDLIKRLNKISNDYKIKDGSTDLKFRDEIPDPDEPEDDGFDSDDEFDRKFNVLMSNINAYHPGNPSPSFQYRCGLKSVVTDPIDPRQIKHSEFPCIAFGYGGARRWTDIDISQQDPRFLTERAVDEEFERLTILFEIDFVKFENDINIIKTSARLHDMVGAFVDKLRTAPPDLSGIANIEDARLGSVSPLLMSGTDRDNPGEERSLIFAIELDYTYLMGY